MNTNSLIILLSIVFVLCAALAFFLTPLSIKVAQILRIVDIPKDDRRMHKKEMPRAGGLAIFVTLSFFVTLTIYFFGEKLISVVPFENKSEIYDAIEFKLPALLIGGGIMFFVGLIDDKYNLPAIVKLLGQVLSALVVFLLGIKIDSVYFIIGNNIQFSFFISLFVTVFYIILVTNIINLIDGLDGLAAGVALVSSAFISYAAYIHGHYTVTILFVMLAGAMFGFLPFNFYPAKTFLGDMGSQFIGFFIACSSIIGPAKEATILTTVVPVLVLGVPMLDTAMAFLRRVFSKKSFMEPDKKHIHHRVFQNKFGHARSVLLLYCVSGVMGLSAVCFSRGQYLEFIAGFTIAIIIVIVLIVRGKNK